VKSQAHQRANERAGEHAHTSRAERPGCALYVPVPGADSSARRAPRRHGRRPHGLL